ncbi:Uncharacterised protein [Escherichia coli]|uniref:Uncharacterized protein n=1 Tax=Escherichia coli TaxID=562 RepID=A0A2X1KH52_ECOLX|nr:Uncharacterised protein [Escherichia coli]
MLSKSALAVKPPWIKKGDEPPAQRTARACAERGRGG